MSDQGLSQHNRAQRGREPSLEGEEWLTVTDMAQRAGMSFVRMRRLLERGAGPGPVHDLRAGLPAPRQYRVRAADFESWAEGYRRASVI